MYLVLDMVSQVFTHRLVYLSQSAFPLLPQRLHFLPSRLPNDFKLLPFFFARDLHASPPANTSSHAARWNLTNSTAPAPALRLCPRHAFVARRIDRAAPLALAVPCFQILELCRRCQHAEAGRHGGFVRCDGVPGRAEPAGQVEEGYHEGLEKPEDRRNASSENTGVRDIHFGLGSTGGRGSSEEFLRIGCCGWQV